MKKILIVNNDFDTLSLLKMWLEKKFYEVVFTEDKNEVAALILKLKPALIIIDVMQTETVQNVKSYYGAGSVPILLMTGYTNRERDINSAADDIIEKPFFTHLLEEKIERLIENRA